jgi:hypothetical protein
MENIIILCPSHDINDKRINRITKVLSKRYNTKLFYEESYRLNNNNEEKNIFYLKNKFHYFKVKSILRSQNINSQFHLYIHDPGVFGLMLCWWWSKYKNVNSITFDYHDWIPWEIPFHIKKIIKSPRLIKLFSKLIHSFIKQFFNSLKINNLVGISFEQIQEFKKDFKLLNTKDLILPNTRKKIFSKKSTNNRKFDGVLWVGNVMRGRDLDILNTYLKDYNKKNNTEYRLYIIGNIFDQDYFKSLVEQDHVLYLNLFKSDSEILKKIQNYNVAGFFYGWDDIYGTGINKIASPNKAHSYINIGIPTIMGNHMTSLKSSFENNRNSIFWIDGYLDFEKSINYIKVNYNTIIQNFDIHTKWEDELELEISNFFLNKKN